MNCEELKSELLFLDNELKKIGHSSIYMNVDITTCKKLDADAVGYFYCKELKNFIVFINDTENRLYDYINYFATEEAALKALISKVNYILERNCTNEITK